MRSEEGAFDGGFLTLQRWSIGLRWPLALARGTSCSTWCRGCGMLSWLRTLPTPPTSPTPPGQCPGRGPPAPSCRAVGGALWRVQRLCFTISCTSLLRYVCVLSRSRWQEAPASGHCVPPSMPQYGEEHVKEVENLWCALCTWQCNIRIALNYLARLTCVSGNVALMMQQAKRIAVCFSRSKAKPIVTELIKDLKVSTSTSIASLCGSYS